MNLCIFRGNLTRDPELKHIPSGTAVCTFSIAINSYYKDKEGQKHEQTTFLDLEAWGTQAELIAQYLTKGRSAIFQCEAKEDTWKDKESGQNRRKVKFRVNNVEFLPGQGNASKSSESSQSSDSQESNEDAYAAAGVGDEEVPF